MEKYKIYSKEKLNKFNKIKLDNFIINKLNNIFKTKENNNAFEIKDDRIFKLIFNNNIKIENLKRYRFFYIPSLLKKIENLKSIKDPNLLDNVCQVVKYLLNSGVKVYLHGGTLRDFFSKGKIFDIDLVVDKNTKIIKNICNQAGWPCELIIPKYNYVLYGSESEKGVSLESTYINDVFFVPLLNHEFTISDLAYSFEYNLLIDITGNGLKDVLCKQIRITPPKVIWDKWALNDYKKPLRYFKLIQKGFKPINDETKNFIINFIQTHWNDIYLQPVSKKYMVPKILHFLIVNITNGEINLDNKTIKFGANKNRLMSYLKVFIKILKDSQKKELIQLLSKLLINFSIS